VIDRAVLFDLSQNGLGHFHLVADARFVRPADDPPLAGPALRRDQEAREFCSVLALGHQLGQKRELRLIVVAALAGTVQREDKRIFLCRFERLRRQEPVMESLVLVMAARERIRALFKLFHNVIWRRYA
jgi:hypothetical protein